MNQSFWDFSLALYGAAGVQEECLRLQDDHGLDVNLILLCAFLGARHGVRLCADDLVAARLAVRPWQEDIVRPLRAARRSLKAVGASPEAAEAAAQLRARVKDAELEAERGEHAILDAWIDGRLGAWPRGEPRAALLANLQALFLEYGIGPERLTVSEAMRHLIAAAG